MIIFSLFVLFIFTPKFLFSEPGYGSDNLKILPADSVKDPRAPEYIDVHIQMNKPLITGETGTIELQAQLLQRPGTQRPEATWNPNSKTPLVVWLASPKDSAIEFLDRRTQ